MIINKTIENGCLTFALEGRLDTNTAPLLETAIISAFDEAKKVVMDFSSLAYVSSAGLRVLLNSQKMATDKGVPMILTRVSEEIMDVFDMTGFSDILTIE